MRGALGLRAGPPRGLATLPPAVKRDANLAADRRLATHPDLAHTSGRYYADCREREPASSARDLEAARRLWNLSCGWVGIAVEDTQWTT